MFDDNKQGDVLVRTYRDFAWNKGQVSIDFFTDDPKHYMPSHIFLPPQLAIEMLEKALAQVKEMEASGKLAELATGEEEPVCGFADDFGGHIMAPSYD